MKASITTKVGNGISGSIFFEATSEKEITRKEAREAQDKLGHHPDGYNFFGFTCSKLPNGTYIAAWQCSTSCD